MISSNRREQHRHRVSYEEEVGSDFGDADEMEASFGLGPTAVEECEYIRIATVYASKLI